jgi:hypothetical protein
MDFVTCTHPVILKSHICACPYPLQHAYTSKTRVFSIFYVILKLSLSTLCTTSSLHNFRCINEYLQYALHNNIYSMCSIGANTRLFISYLYFHVDSSRGYLLTNLSQYPCFRANPLLTTCPLLTHFDTNSKFSTSSCN